MHRSCRRRRSPHPHLAVDAVEIEANPSVTGGQSRLSVSIRRCHDDRARPSIASEGAYPASSNTRRTRSRAAPVIADGSSTVSISTPTDPDGYGSARQPATADQFPQAFSAVSMTGSSRGSIRMPVVTRLERQSAAASSSRSDSPNAPAMVRSEALLIPARRKGGRRRARPPRTIRDGSR